MKRLLAAVVGILVFAANAKVITLEVAQGQTVDFDTALAAAGQTLEAGDTVIKTGDGKLTATATNKGLTYNTRISEGIYEVTVVGGLGKDGGQVRVKRGASLVINCSSKIGGGFGFWIDGEGHPSLGNTAGAISFKSSNFEIVSGCLFHLDTGDAVMYSGVGHSANGPFTSARWDLQGYALTLKGSSNSAGFRFRYASGAGATLAGGTKGIVVDHCRLSHGGGGTFTKDGNSYVVTLKNGGMIGPENQSFMDLFAELRFDPGTGMANNGSNNAIALPVITGFPQINGDITPTINKRWNLRATDLASDTHLTAAKALTFAAGANLVLPAECLSALDIGSTRTLATSSVSITGLPKLSLPADGPQCWKVELTDAKTLTLKYDPAKMPAGAVNVRDWGVLPGADKAEANTAAFNQGLATLGEGATVFFPQGEYLFGEPLAVGGKTGLSLIGDGLSATVKVTDEAAASVIAAQGGSGLTVTGLRIAGGAGVAVAADSVAGLTVTNNAFVGVEGVIADVPGKYPVSAVNCADVFVSDNTVLGGKTYDALAYVAGGSVRPGSEPQTASVILRVPDGSEEDFAAAFARTGLAAFPDGASIVKVGRGALTGTNLIDGVVGVDGHAIGGVCVNEGVFYGRQNSDFGASSATVRVEDGATLRLRPFASDANTLKNRTIYLSGTGCDGQGAIALLGASWQTSAACTFRLEGDALIDASGITGQNGFFSSPILYLNGHALTVRGDYPANSADFRWRETARVASSGTLVFDKVYMTASYATGNGFRCDSGVTATLDVVNGASVGLSTAHILKMFPRVNWETGTKLWINYDASHAIAEAAFKTVCGAPSYTSSDKLTTTSVSDALVARAADLVAGKRFIAPLRLSFGADARIEVEGIDDLPREDKDGNPAIYAVASGSTALSGKPRKGASLVGKRWRVYVEGNSVLLAPTTSMTVIVK